MPPSTLDYWVRTGLVTPSIRSSQGRRIERLWSLRDVLVVRTIRALRTAGASLQAVRRAREEIERSDQDLTAVRLYWDGTDVLVTDQDGTRSLARRPGQQVFQVVVLPLDEWHMEHERDPQVEVKSLRKVQRENAAYQRTIQARTIAKHRVFRDGSSG